jgi:hypothetical protein
MTLAEEDLLKKVVVTVISDRSTVSAGEIATLIAPRLEVEIASLVLQQLSSSRFLLFLPRVEMVVLLTEWRPLLRAATFSIACKRWPRFTDSTGGALPSLVEFELRGIPPHAWESSTMVQLLSPFAWIRRVHPNTLGLMDLAVFHCTTWTKDVASIPANRELWIVEPPSVPNEAPLGKKALIYPIEFWFSVINGPADSVPAARSLVRGHRFGDRQWDGFASGSRSHSPVRGHSMGQGRAAAGDERRCRPAHERLGPAAGSSGRVDQSAHPGPEETFDGAHRHPGSELFQSCAPPSTPASK